MKKALFIITFLSCWLAQAETPQAIPEKASLCAACHGAEGASTNPQWPHIAGQHSHYLQKQLLDFKKGKTRTAPTMAAIVAGLSEADITALSTYYAGFKAPEGRTLEKYVQRGEQIYRGGDLDKHIAACIACHGPRGHGNKDAAFPWLSGQQAAYTIQQLEAFKNKTRSNDYNGIMRDISARMDKADMEAVAYYIQGLY